MSAPTYASMFTTKPDPGLAARGPNDILRIVASLIAPLRKQAATYRPQSDAQMQAEAQGYADSRINPVIDRITSEASARAGRGMAAIGGLSTQLQAAEAPAAGDAMKNALMAAAARSAIGQSLSGSAAAEGAQQQGGIAGKLALMGNGGASDVYAANAGGLGKGIAGEIGAKGATGAADTVNRGAADAGFASTLPGITALAGVRSGRILQEQTNAGVKSEISQLMATVPGLVSGIFENLKTRNQQTKQQASNLEAQAAQLAATAGMHLSDTEVQKAIARQGLGVTNNKLITSATIAADNNNTKTTIANTKAAAAATATDAKAQKAAQAAVVKANSVAIAYMNKNVKPVPVYQTVMDTTTLPPTQKRVITGYKGYPSYYDIIHGIESQITPILGPHATQADIVRVAQRIVNNDPHYKAGMNGRPGTGAAPAPAPPVAGSHGAAP